MGRKKNNSAMNSGSEFRLWPGNRDIYYDFGYGFDFEMLINNILNDKMNDGITSKLSRNQHSYKSCFLFFHLFDWTVQALPISNGINGTTKLIQKRKSLPGKIGNTPCS